MSSGPGWKLTKKIDRTSTVGEDAKNKDATNSISGDTGSENLIITLYEGVDLSIPDMAKYNGRAVYFNLPYALVEYGKFQTFVESSSGTQNNPRWGEKTASKFNVFHTGEIVCRFYSRNLHASPGSGRSQDIFLGDVRANVPLEGHTSNGWWLNVQHGTGKIRIGVEYIEKGNQSFSSSDFLRIGRRIGRGKFGSVTQVCKKDTKRYYTSQWIWKSDIVSVSDLETTLRESTSYRIKNPFIVPLEFTYQSDDKFYLASASINGGELFYYLMKQGHFDVDRSRLYIAEIICAIECLQDSGISWSRDLKPENICLDYSGHIAICDFGLHSLSLNELGIRDPYALYTDANSITKFGRTPHYMAPEVFLGQGNSNTTDWWVVGVLLYQMLTGEFPFDGNDADEIRRKVLSGTVQFSDTDTVLPVSQDLLTKLLDRSPENRLGAIGSSAIRAHPFFLSIDWEQLAQRRYEPTFKPPVMTSHTGVPWCGGGSSAADLQLYNDLAPAHAYERGGLLEEYLEPRRKRSEEYLSRLTGKAWQNYQGINLDVFENWGGKPSSENDFTH